MKIEERLNGRGDQGREQQQRRANGPTGLLQVRPQHVDCFRLANTDDQHWDRCQQGHAWG
jgi:hypothetical protein